MHQPLPPVPRIDDPRLYLDVHTHRSVRVSKNDEYGDTERLAVLGEKVFGLAVTNALFNDKPMLDAKALDDKVQDYTSSTQIEKWVEFYHLKGPLVFTQESTDLINSTKETCFFFHSYLGAIFIRAGIAPIQQWVARLINPDAEPSTPPQRLGSPASPYHTATTSSSWAAQPTSAPPPLPPSPPRSTGTTGILQSLNQTAVQRGIKIEYTADKTGQAHMPIWTVQCIVDNAQRGVGQGKNQKVAKEEAAKQAWVALGWGSI